MAISVEPPEDASFQDESEESRLVEGQAHPARDKLALLLIWIFAVSVGGALAVSAVLAWFFNKVDIFIQVFTTTFSSVSTLAGTTAAYYFHRKK